MTIEELPESTRCSDCGTWLPREALECPKCGRPRDLAMTGPPGRSARSRRLLIGGGAAAALVVGVVIVWTLNLSVTPGPSPSQTLGSGLAIATHSPSARPTTTSSPIPPRTPAPSRSPAPTPAPTPQIRARLILPLETPDMGSRAIVTAAALNVRRFVGVNSEVDFVLGAGSALLLRDGPVAADGYEWYYIYYQPAFGEPQFAEGGGSGWVASGLSGEQPTLLAIEAARCPAVPVTVALLSSMTNLARRECLGSGSFEVSGMVDLCYEGPIGPFEYDPPWFDFSCYSVVEPGTPVSMQMHFLPKVSVPGQLGRGDLVRLVGHVNDPGAEACRVTSGPPESIVEAQQEFLLYCRGAFVIAEIEVTGHIDLPNPFE